MKIFTIVLFFLLSISISLGQVSVVEAFPNLSFSRPIDLQHAPDGTDRIFVVSQNGDIDVFSTADSTISETKLFLSLQDSVRRVHGEEGLLGLTFHPDFLTNGYFYVSYNAVGLPRKSIIARYQVSADPDSADQSTKTIILELEQPSGNHNGGQIAFGPDGYLYFGLGDGGGSNDTYGNGQNLKTLLGSMLRINVDDTSSYGNYAIPEDNPFVGNDSSYREEIYAYGLRNPWRFSFDPVTDRLWLGDVGQGTWEEIDIIEIGGNYGWPLMEGANCFPLGTQCDDSGLIYPIAEYRHNQGIAVTGGHVYRGSKVPDLYGKYIYGDYGSGLLWTIVYDGVNDPVNEFLMSSGRTISAFGVDKDYELYICDLSGAIYKFYQEAVSNLQNETIKPGSFKLYQNYPNPFNPTTTINYQLATNSKVQLKIFDISGREIKTLVDRQQTAGEHSVLFNASNFPSGIYFYRIVTSAGFEQSHKMVLLK